MIETNKCLIKTKDFLNVFHSKTNIQGCSHISHAVERLQNNMFESSEEDININYEDLTYCTQNTKNGVIQIVKTKGIYKGLLEIINNSISDVDHKDTIQHIIIHFTLPSSFNLMNITKAIDLIHDSLHEDADVCVCISFTNSEDINNMYQIDSFIFYSKENRYIMNP